MSADARLQGSGARGRLRIYLGCAPGADTSCALLSEGRRRAEHGTDVAVARAETHGRPYTEELLVSLEVIPSAKVPYQGALAEEMDLGAVLARGPAVALVDDYAHRNAPGSRHRAMAGRRGPARGGIRRDLHHPCRAPGSPGRRGGEAAGMLARS